MNKEAPFYRIRDLDTSERPRERLEQKGADVLTNAELLAILLRVGVQGENAVQVGQRLLDTFGQLQGLRKVQFEDMKNQHGLGPAKAAQIVAAIELARRFSLYSSDDRPAIHSPEDAATLVRFEMSALDHEELWVMVLDTRNRVISIEHKYKGSLNSSMVRIGELFKPAIQRNGASIILFHNHPSGDPSPSPEDIALTRGVVQAGKLMDIDVLDHLVIGSDRFISMKDKGLGF